MHFRFAKNKVWFTTVGPVGKQEPTGANGPAAAGWLGLKIIGKKRGKKTIAVNFVVFRQVRLLATTPQLI